MLTCHFFLTPCCRAYVTQAGVSQSMLSTQAGVGHTECAGTLLLGSAHSPRHTRIVSQDVFSSEAVQGEVPAESLEAALARLNMGVPKDRDSAAYVHALAQANPETGGIAFEVLMS